ncbi:MAG TPA: TolC family protein [Flavobacteriales bacterium]|nr:TolC family protein [Flavobacteriales bacterium]
MKTTFILLFLAAAVTTNAQLVITGFDQVLELAKKQNRDLEIAREKTTIDELTKKASLSPLMPQVKSISSFDYNFSLPVQLIPAQFLGGKPGEYIKAQFGTKYNATTGIEASMPLVNTSAWTEIKIASLSLEISRLNLKNINYEMDKNLARAYYYSLVSFQAMQISARNLSSTDSIYQSAKSKFEAGVLEQLDYNRLYNSYIQVQSMHEQNKLAYEKNLLGLKFMLALDTATQVEFGSNLTAPAANNLTITTTNFPSVQLKEISLLQSKLYLKKDKLKYIPEVSLFARYQAQAQRNEFDFFDSDKGWFNIGVAGLRIDWPLFTGFSRNTAVKRSYQKMKIAELEFENEKLKTLNENTETMLSLKAAQVTFNNNAAALELASQNISIASEKYKQGVISIDQYLNIYNEALQMQNTYLRSLSDLLTWQTIVELKNKL